MVSRAEKFPLGNEEQYKKASVVVKWLMDIIRAVKGEEKYHCEPFKEGLARLTDRFREMRAPVEKAVDIMKEKMTTWWAAEEEKKEKEAAKIEADNRKRLEKAKEPARVKIKETPDAPVKSVGATTAVKHWTYKVVDEAKVPRAYLQLNKGTIMGAIRQGKREIAGLEIYQEIGITTR